MRARSGLLALLATAALVAGGAGPSAVAAGDGAGATEASSSRLPFTGEVARIFPDAADGTRVVQPGAGLRGPDLEPLTGEEPCTGEDVVVRGTSGRAVVYRPGPEAADPPVRPTVQERTFASPADARAALAELRAAVRECRGDSYSTRSETYTWFQRSTPRFGEDRLGWSLRMTEVATPRPTYALHHLVLRGDTLVHVVVTARDGLPSAERTQRLARLALDTL